MNPGLGTSEASRQGLMAPTVICRDCRAQLSVEESEDHDCGGVPTKTPSPTKAILVKTAVGASSFIDSLKADVNTLTHKPNQAPPTHARSSSYDFQKLGDATVGGTQAKYRTASVSEIRSAAAALKLTPMATELHRRRSTESSGVQNALFQCNVQDVRVTAKHVAVYSLVTRVPSLAASNITVERRFREFYVFAQHVCAMFPSADLWQRLPPKTYCTFRCQNTLSDGFLLRRRQGLEDFLRSAIDKMMLGVAQATIAQWYLLRLFLNLPSRAPIAAPTDRSFTAAMHELKKHARQFSGWTVSRKPAECDTVFEKVADNFLMVKRVVTCHFPARAVFDMIMNRSIDAEASGRGAGMAWAPFVESEEVLSRENDNTLTVRTVFTDGGWSCKKLQMISLKTWRVDDSGTIAIVMIPAEASAWNDPRIVDSGLGSRVDCILGGWLITPTPWEGSCSVTWLMQANFGQCDPRAEFTGCQSRSTPRRCLHLWADEVVHLTQALGQVYDTEHYRQLGPLTTNAKVCGVTSPQPI